MFEVFVFFKFLKFFKGLYMQKQLLL